MKFEVYRDNRSEYRWRLRANNNEIIASGEGYKNRGDCLHAIGLVMDSELALIEILPKELTEVPDLDKVPF